VKLDAEMLRKLALTGAKSKLRELEVEVERLRDYVRQLSGVTAPTDGRRKKKEPKRRARRAYTDKFKAEVVKEARAADSASSIGRKHNINPNLVRLWMQKAEK